ncbi:ExbD/TolR family protein [Croceitalea sp. MTPC5]|uniref:ExbD/TolR family protein n=1 Tax=Croceitalea sp. MTPC5 TaxID=3056565 RepID=UPI0030CFE5A8
MMKRNRQKRKVASIATSSLPDIVFILLFFFMTVTTMKKTNFLVENTLPNATETEELYQSDGIIEILVGNPTKHNGIYSMDVPKIQLGNRLAEIDGVAPYVLAELAMMPENLRKTAMVSLKIDKTVSMGIISDIKNELQKINMLKINYTTFQGDIFLDLK